jgi:hypothetical protein
LISNESSRINDFNNGSTKDKVISEAFAFVLGSGSLDEEEILGYGNEVIRLDGKRRLSQQGFGIQITLFYIRLEIQ